MWDVIASIGTGLIWATVVYIALGKFSIYAERRDDAVEAFEECKKLTEELKNDIGELRAQMALTEELREDVNNMLIKEGFRKT